MMLGFWQWPRSTSLADRCDNAPVKIGDRIVGRCIGVKHDAEGSPTLDVLLDTDCVPLVRSMAGFKIVAYIEVPRARVSPELTVLRGSVTIRLALAQG